MTSFALTDSTVADLLEYEDLGADADPGAAAPEGPRREAPWAVVADDDADARDLTQFRLERAGFTVFPAVDGATAWDEICDTRPDLVIVEWSLPGRTGLDLCRDVRDERTLRHTRILVVTRRHQPLYREWAHQVGCDAILTKPFSGPDLTRTVRGLLPHHAAVIG
jgi:DNA-binding response OmpR family regulator